MMKTVTCVLLAANLLRTPAQVQDSVYIFQDLRIGDTKQMVIRDTGDVRITSADCKNCSWSVETTWRTSVAPLQGYLHFNVPGLDDPPPSGYATFWTAKGENLRFKFAEFTEYGPGTTANPVINHWVEEHRLVGAGRGTSPDCDLTKVDGVFADVVEGDMKRITIDNASVTIQPCGNDEKWVVNTVLDEHCRAVVDFKASGKPVSTPGPLFMTRLYMVNGGHIKLLFEFSETFLPLNHWVQLDHKVNCSSPSPDPAPAVLAV